MKRSIHNRRAGPSTPEAGDAAATDREMLLSMRPNGRLAVACLVAAGASWFLGWMLMHHGTPLLLLVPMLFGAGFLFAIQGIVQGSGRTTLVRRGTSLYLCHKNLLWRNMDTFDDVREVHLAKSVRGHGVVPLALDNVRKTLKAGRTPRNVKGLSVSTDGRTRSVRIRASTAELVRVAESVNAALRQTA